jgi:Predicted transcriptional regulators
MELDYTALGKNLRKLRKAADLTQKELAEKIDRTESHIGQIENDRGKPGLDVVAALAKALNTNIEHILYGDSYGKTSYFARDIEELISHLGTQDKAMAMEIILATVKAISENRSS